MISDMAACLSSQMIDTGKPFKRVISKLVFIVL